MKYFLRCMFLCLLALTLLVSCDPGNDSNMETAMGTEPATPPTSEESGENQTESNSDAVLVLAQNKRSEYRIIYSNGNEAVKTAAQTFQSNIQTRSKTLLLTSLDNFPEQLEYEILIGPTNRAESTVSPPLSEKEILIKADGKKLIVLAGRDEFLSNALQELLNSMTYENSTLTVPNDIYIRKEINAMVLKVASYNIKNGELANYNYQLLANDIIASGASIVGLQEVDQLTSRNGNRDTLKLLSEYTGMQYYTYLPTISPYRGGEYGIAVLSKYPIDAIDFEYLPLAEGVTEPRGVLKTVININGSKLNFFVTHCDSKSIDLQLERISKMTKNCDPYVLVGDFNCQTVSKFTIFENTTFATNNTNKIATTHDGKQIDHIICSQSISINESSTVDSGYSDHLLLVSSITVNWEEQ